MMEAISREEGENRAALLSELYFYSNLHLQCAKTAALSFARSRNKKWGYV